MKQAVLVEPGRLEIRETDNPKPGPGDAVVEVHAALTCGTDLKAFRRGHPKMPCPTPFGHEFAGVVTDIGSNVTNFAEGDTLMAANTGPCRECFYCRRDQENLCTTLMETMILGAYADRVLVPERVLRTNAFHKPEGMEFANAALLEPLSSVCFGLTHARQREVQGDAVVVIVGAGPIAMLWLLALRAHGAGRVVVAGRRRPRLEEALRLGATDVIGEDDDLQARLAELTDGRGADLVVECTGLPEIWEQSTRMVRKGGRVILFGGCAKGTEVRLDTYRLHYDGVSIHSPFHFRPRDVAEARRLLTTADVGWASLVTSRAPLAELPEVFSRLQDGKDLKIAVQPDAALSNS